jgi:hypothetical protein
MRPENKQMQWIEWISFFVIISVIARTSKLIVPEVIFSKNVMSGREGCGADCDDGMD